MDAKWKILNKKSRTQILRFFSLLVLVALVFSSFSSVFTAKAQTEKTVYVVVNVDAEFWTDPITIGHDLYLNPIYGQNTNPHPTIDVREYSRTSPMTVAPVFDASFRAATNDSDQNPVKITWFAEADFLIASGRFVWADGSPAGVSGYMAIRDLLVNNWGTEIKNYGDAIEYHHHFMIYDGTWQRYDNGPDAGYPSYQEDALNSMILDRNYYPSAFRVGWHLVSPAVSSWLENWIPFEFSDTEGDQYPTHPLGMDRWQTKAVWLHEDSDSITSAFQKARDYGSAIYSSYNYDREDTTDYIATLQDSLNAETRDPANADVVFKYVTAAEAMQQALGYNDVTPPTLTLTPQGGSYAITSTEPLWQNQPYVALKYADGTYMHVSATSTGTNTWSVTPTSLTSPLVAIGVGASDLKGNPGTATLLVNPPVQRSLTVTSAHDSPNPTAGVHSYADGASVTASVSSPVTEGSLVWTCTGWTGTGSVPSSSQGTSATFIISQNSAITWNWQSAPATHYSSTTDFAHLKKFTVNSAVGAGTDYQVKLIVHFGSGVDGGNVVYLNGNCRSDFGDVRFVGSDNSTFLNYWMENKYSGDYATFWVKINDNLSSSQSTNYIYYGNNSYSSASDGVATFILFDDFDGTSLNSTLWTPYGAIGIPNYANLSVSSGLINITGPNGQPSGILSKSSFLYNVRVHSRAFTTNKIGEAMVGFKDGSLNANQAMVGSLERYAPVYFSSDRLSGISSNVGMPISGNPIYLDKNFHIFDEVRVNSTHTFSFVDGVLIINNAGVPTAPLPATLTIWWDGEVLADYFSVTKYVYPEPQVSVNTQNEYSLTVNMVGSGSVVKVPDKASYHLGDSVQLTATPAAGWAFSGWSGDLTGSTNPATLVIDATPTVTATFAQNTYTLTVTPVGSGSVTRNNTGPYSFGDGVLLTAVPVSGWSFAGWSGDLSGLVNPMAITLNGNKTVTATFAQNTYTISVTQGAHGLMVPGTTTVYYGDSQEFTITPDSGYHVFDVVADGVSQGPVTTYTFGNVQASHTISALFAIDTYVPFSIVSNSTISELAFDSTTQVLSFTAEGPAGTMGSTNITVAKSLMSDISALKVFLDGTPKSYSVVDLGNYWTICFIYQHSTHRIIMDFAPKTASKLTVTVGAGQSLVAGQLSAVITVQRQDQYGNPVTSGSTTLILSSTSINATFYSDDGITKITSVNINEGQSQVSFRYNDTKTGSPTLTAFSSGLTSTTTTFTINAGVAAKLVFITGADQTLKAGQLSSVITVQRQDQYGNPVTSGSTTVSLTCNSRNALFYSDAGITQTNAVTIKEGSSTVDFWFKATSKGSPTLTVSAPGLTSTTKFKINK